MDKKNSVLHSVEPQRLPDLKPIKHETTTVTLRKNDVAKPDVLTRLVGARGKGSVYAGLANLGVENPKALYLAVPPAAIEAMFIANSEVLAHMPTLARVRFNVQSLTVLDDALNFSGDIGLEGEDGQKQTARYTAEIHVDRTFRLIAMEVNAPTPSGDAQEAPLQPLVAEDDGAEDDVEADA